MNLIKFKRDTSFRNDLFTPESFAHPAKMDSQLLIWITERFTKEGETILDPMFGSGTTMLACILGRNVIGVELESKFCEMAKANWEKVRQRPQLGSTMGTCQILQGDARNLEGLLVDKIVTSPPYEEGGGHGGTPTKCALEKHQSSMGQGTEQLYGKTAGNIGNLKSVSYLEAMSLVYAQCFRVLKSQGLMILVTKNFIREQKEVRLDSDTIKLCEQVGFKFQERWYRELPSQSFWRVIYRQKYPDAPELKYEDVLVFVK